MPDPSAPTISGRGLPIPFLTAAWAGMSYDDVVAGLNAGSILPPPGSPAGWLPQAGTVGVAYAPDAAAPMDDARASVAAAHPGRADVARWFTTLDPALAAEAFDALWQRAGGTDGARAATLTSYLARTLLGERADDSAGTRREGPASGIAARLDRFLADPAHRAHVVDLTGMNGSEMAAQAATDVGMRYALQHMDAIALGGNRLLFANANADGRLDRFDRDTGEPVVSDAWLEDRGKFLAWKLAQDGGGETAIAGSEDWTFVDRSTLDAAGAPLTLQLRTGADQAGANQVIFGNDDAEVIKGVRGSDRIYAGGGDDVVRGGAGGDHLEGGAGDDWVGGGAGDDELVGNQGDDEIDGNAGRDRLAGGSGADILTGGRGDDRMEGGLGFDTYVIDAGDGADTLVDADGVGAIELDGVALDGAMAQNDGGGWRSADGRVEFTFAGDAQEGGTLTLRSFAAGADHAGVADNVVRVKDWKNGDLGITLSGSPGSPGAEDAAPSPATAAAGADGQDATDEDAVIASGESAGEGAVVASNGFSPASAELADAAPAVMASPGSPDPGAGAVSLDALATSASVPEASAPSADTEAFDFDAALDALLDPGGSAAKGLDPAALQRGVEAFSGVLAPPDVTASALDASTFASNALTSADIADAIASDVSADDFHAETGAAALAALGGASMDALMVPPSPHAGVAELALRK